MVQRTLRSNLRCRSAATDGRLAVHTQMLLILMGILLISAFSAAGVFAGSEISLQEKGQKTMHQAAPALNKDLPPLDAVQPARIDTFTFGLG